MRSTPAPPIVALAAGLFLAGTYGCKEMGRNAAHPVPTNRTGTTVSVTDPFPAGDLHEAHFAFEFAVYHLPRPKANPITAIKNLAAKSGLAVHDGALQSPADTPTVCYRLPAMSEYAPPDLETLRFSGHGLSEDERRALQSSRSVTVMGFVGPAARALATYRSALALAAELRNSTGGLLWDENTRDVFSRDAWALRSEGWDDGLPDVSRQVTIHAYLNGDLLRLVTLGMGKFALPDVAVNDVASSDSRSMGNLVNLTCQLMLEQGRLDQAGRLDASIHALRNRTLREHLLAGLKPNAKKRLVLSVGHGKLQQGDADNRLLDILFPGAPATLQERQAQAVATLFGVNDAIVDVKHSPELLAASRRARSAALKLKPRYGQERPALETLLVKGPFATPDGGQEWMWVEVVRWRGTTIEGILQNQPFRIPALKAGTRVTVQEADVFDYILKKNDGTIEGNETGRLLGEQQTAPAQPSLPGH